MSLIAAAVYIAMGFNARQMRQMSVPIIIKGVRGRYSTRSRYMFLWRLWQSINSVIQQHAWTIFLSSEQAPRTMRSVEDPVPLPFRQNARDGCYESSGNHLRIIEDINTSPEAYRTQLLSFKSILTRRLKKWLRNPPRSRALQTTAPNDQILTVPRPPCELSLFSGKGTPTQNTSP